MNVGAGLRCTTPLCSSFTPSSLHIFLSFNMVLLRIYPPATHCNVGISVVFASIFDTNIFYNMDPTWVFVEHPKSPPKARSGTHFAKTASLSTRGRFVLPLRYLNKLYTVAASFPTLSWMLLIAWIIKGAATFRDGQNTTNCTTPRITSSEILRGCPTW
jgi:hypothetical protein